MILGDKIIKLRKQFAWSQEELAEKMNVSRQSVSKWEGGNSIPDLNKILMMGEIFGVSTDYLVKDEIEESEAITEDIEPGIIKITLEEANLFVENKVNTARNVSKGVLLCIYSVIPLILLLGLATDGKRGLSSNIAAAIGLVFLFFMIAIAVSIFIKSTQHQSSFDKLEKNSFELVYGVRSIFTKKTDEYRQIYYSKVSIGVMLVMTSVVPLLLASLLGGTSELVLIMVVVLFILLGVGIYILIHASTMYNALNCLIGEGNYSPEKKKETKKIEKLATFYWPLMTAIYLGWSLWTMAWGITWIIWPIAAIAFAAFIGLFGLFDKENK